MISLDTPFFPNSAVTKKRLSECIDSTWVGYQGKYAVELAKLLCDLYKTKFCIPVSSGTHAMYMALAGLELPAGSEVIVPTECYSGNVVAITMNNLKPKFIDCVADSPNTDVDNIKNAITTKTKAVLVPHMYGQVVDLAGLKSHKIFVIEDTALTLQSSPNSVSDIICTSFHNKIITAGEGGAVMLNNKTLYEKLRKLWVPSQNNKDDTLFLSGRLNNLSCAVAVSQIEVLDQIVQKRNGVATLYNQMLNQKKHYDVCWRYQYKCQNPKKMIEYLRKNGVESRQVFEPMHYRFSKKKFPNAQEWSSKHIDLPSGPALSEKNINYICNIIKKYESKQPPLTEKDYDKQ